MKKGLKEDSTPSKWRLWYNDWVKENAKGNVLDVGKSRFWDYEFSTIDINPELMPSFIGDTEKMPFADKTWDMVLCNGMYECVRNPQKMVDEVFRVSKGPIIFGFVGKEFKPYNLNKSWKYYDNNIDFHGLVSETKNFDNKYHFIICKK